MKPWQAFVHNLAPWLRYKAKYMFCFAVIPNSLKGQAAKKYYDFAADYQINELYHTGIYGVKVLLFGTSLDCPGRSELLSM